MRKLILTILVWGTVLVAAEAGLPGGPVGTYGSMRPSGCSFPDSDQAVIKVKVVIAQANVRLAPKGDSDILIVANRGQIFDVVEKAGDWYQILLPESRKGFIFFSTVVELAVEAPKTPVVRPEPVKPPKAEAPVVKPEPVQPPKAEAPVVRPEPAKPEPVRESGAEATAFSMVLLRAGVFLASDSAYKDVYGTGPVFGLELRIGKKALAGWLEATFRSASGKSTFTKEDTKATIIGGEAGALYRFLTGKLSAYAGAGLGYYSLKETNSFIGEASGGGIGFCALGGATYALSSSIVVDARIKFSTSKMKPADFDINVGGLTFGLGVGIRI